MGHYVNKTEHLFDDVKYNVKTTPELREAMTRKRAELVRRVQERHERIRAVREDYAIDAEQLALLVMRFQETRGNQSFERQGRQDSVVPAGVIANLVREQQMIDSEQSQTDKLDLVLRNLTDHEWYAHPRTGEIASRTALHVLDDFELAYLGF